MPCNAYAVERASWIRELESMTEKRVSAVSVGVKGGKLTRSGSTLIEVGYFDPVKKRSVFNLFPHKFLCQLLVIEETYLPVQDDARAV